MGSWWLRVSILCTYLSLLYIRFFVYSWQSPQIYSLANSEAWRKLTNFNILWEKENIRWNSVGLSRVHRREGKLIQLQDRNQLCHHRGRPQGDDFSGVGFLMSRIFHANIIRFSSTSDRVIVKLSKTHTFNIIHVYP